LNYYFKNCFLHCCYTVHSFYLNCNLLNLYLIKNLSFRKSLFLSEFFMLSQIPQPCLF
jgi:hypothetical protein